MPVKVVLVERVGGILIGILAQFVLALAFLAALWIAMIPQQFPVPVGVRLWSKDILQGWPPTSSAKGMSTTFQHCYPLQKRRD